MGKVISIVIPVYNEEKNIPVIFNKIKKICQKLDKDIAYEVIFVNDGSTDKSAQIIKKLAREEKGVKYIELSRNFGKEIALTAGLHFANKDAALTLDADLQHPVELIPRFIRKWEKGAEMVIGVRKNATENYLRRAGSFIFSKTMDLIGEIPPVLGETDFRLIDKHVIAEFNKLSQKNRITRGLLDWLGFRKEYVYFRSPRRIAGASHYSFFRLVRLAFSGFVSLSLFPLRLAGYLGVVTTLLSGSLGLFILLNQYILDKPISFIFSNIAALAIFIMFLIGIVLICLGLIALYIANIHSEVLNRPLYVIREKML